MKKVAIITPTYNRAHLLERLYESLRNQTCEDFKWLIIDDGSVDNTREIINKFKQHNTIEIEYYYFENGGKHRALNKAIELCNEELFFIVDSDDILMESAIEDIISIEGTLINKEEFCGVAGMKATFEKKLLSNELPSNIIDATSLEAYYELKLSGDKAEVFYTKILKKYKFPEFEDEKFMTEAVVWHKMAHDGYKIRWFNKIIYLGEYREDGLTNRGLELSIVNSKGKAYFHNQESKFNIPLKWKIYHQANYFRYALLSKYRIKDIWRESKCKIIRFISIFIGIFAIFYTSIRLKGKRG